MNQIKDFINKNPKLTAFYLIWECFHLLMFATGSRGGDGFNTILRYSNNYGILGIRYEGYGLDDMTNYGWEELLFYSIVPILVYFVVFLLRKK